jgi:hypothetical protein
MKVPVRFCSRRSSTWSAEKFFTSAATHTSGASPSRVKRVSGPVPDLPMRTPSHVSAAVFPSAVTIPTPVTTTLRLLAMRLSGGKTGDRVQVTGDSRRALPRWLSPVPYPLYPEVYSAFSSPLRSAKRTSSLRWCRSSFSMIRAR